MVLSQMEVGHDRVRQADAAGYVARAVRPDDALPDGAAAVHARHAALPVRRAAAARDQRPGDYQLGQDMVFFQNKGGLLQELMMMRKDKVAENIVANALGMEDNEHFAMLVQFVEERNAPSAPSSSAIVAC